MSTEWGDRTVSGICVQFRQVHKEGESACEQDIIHVYIRDRPLFFDWLNRNKEEFCKRWLASSLEITVQEILGGMILDDFQ